MKIKQFEMTKKIQRFKHKKGLIDWISAIFQPCNGGKKKEVKIIYSLIG